MQLHCLQFRHAYSLYNLHVHVILKNQQMDLLILNGNHNVLFLNLPKDLLHALHDHVHVRHDYDQAHYYVLHGYYHHNVNGRHVDGMTHIHGYDLVSHIDLDDYYMKYL